MTYQEKLYLRKLAGTVPAAAETSIKEKISNKLAELFGQKLSDDQVNALIGGTIGTGIGGGAALATGQLGYLPAGTAIGGGAGYFKNDIEGKIKELVGKIPLEQRRKLGLPTPEDDIKAKAVAAVTGGADVLNQETNVPATVIKGVTRAGAGGVAGLGAGLGTNALINAGSSVAHDKALEKATRSVDQSNTADVVKAMHERSPEKLKKLEKGPFNINESKAKNIAPALMTLIGAMGGGLTTQPETRKATK